MATRKSTTKKSASRKARSSSTSPFDDIMNFYYNQFEQSAPILKKATEDWYRIAEKLSDASIELGEKIFSPVIGRPETSTRVSKSIAQMLINTQRDITLTAIDSVSKNVKSLRASSGSRAKK